MKILNKSENIILEVVDEDRIKKLLGYPDKFEKVEEEQPSYFQNEKKGKKGGKKSEPIEEEVVEEKIDNEPVEEIDEESIEEEVENN